MFLVVLFACGLNGEPTSVPVVEPTEGVLVEGDEAGECSDGADNDQDGAFDCDDPDCENAPDCESACDLPRSTLLIDVSSDDWDEICACIAYDSDEEIVYCDDGTEVTVPAVSAATRQVNCRDALGATSSWTGCTATLADFDAYNTFEIDVCDPTLLPSGPFFDCLVDSLTE